MDAPHLRVISMTSRYDTLINQRLEMLAKRPAAQVEDILGNMLGLFPTEVLSRITTRFPFLLRAPSPLVAPMRMTPSPELHPLDYEWYFTPETSGRIASIFSASRTQVACLGTPMVAEALSEAGKQAILFDRNPLVSKRLQRMSSIRFASCDLLTEAPAAIEVDGVVFDAPWYPEYIALWLKHANDLISDHGIIAFSLFPTLTRPSAEAERQDLMALAEHLGHVSIYDGVLQYETPLFEERIFEGVGIRADRWRHADLVTISTTSRRRRLPERPRPREELWDSYVVGSQVIKLRAMQRADQAWLIRPVSGVAGYLSSSVSRRDPLRPVVDVWTSRSRIAQVGDRTALAAALHSLEQNGTVISSIQTALPHLSPDEHKNIASQLRELLELEGRA